jgi:SNF2 family DNA or RNA helicase
VSFKGELRGFQQEAFDKMVERRRVLVGYEMGLGKTVITIAAVEHLLDQGTVANGLIVVPSSLKYQWKREIEKFTTDVTIKVVDGTPQQRLEQYRELRAGHVEYTILNYEQVVNDWEYVRHLPRDFVVLDEATAIKNFAAKRTKKIKKLSAKYRFALTGQPIENRPEEIYSIMQWVDPEVLGDYKIFDRTFIVRNGFGGVKYYRNLPTLHATINKAMVRKTRQDDDVRDQLPKVVEEIISVDFDKPGAELYRYIAADLMAELALAAQTHSSFDLWAHYSGEKSPGELETQGKIMSRLTCLRMLCDHPDLLRHSAELYTGTGAPMTGGGIKGGSAYAAQLDEAGLLDKLGRSNKMSATLELIKELLETNKTNKVVIFSFFKETLNILQEATAKLTGSVLFTGDMTALQKDEAKQKFQTDPSCRLFLSSDAGGYGVDLPNANYLISYDLPWSAGKLDQRNARIIRLSSVYESVTLIYMLMTGSIEERQFDMLEQKRAIASAIVDGKGIDAKGRLDLGLKTLTEFLASSTV